ncbi:MAG: PTS sugar transporter subunit IIA [Chlamydiae bacterium]|nr:PTS sugar transporter subunit IIA [Chlamydiota bacterium]
MGLSKYLQEQLIFFLEEEDKQEAIAHLVDLLDQQGKLQEGNKDLFHKAILEREKIVSTGIGIGVAVPHAKLAGTKDFFIAIGIQKYKGIDWNAVDGVFVRLIFMIGGPVNQPTEYLRILSWITQTMKEGQKRKKILQALTASEVVSLLQEESSVP